MSVAEPPVRGPRRPVKLGGSARPGSGLRARGSDRMVGGVAGLVAARLGASPLVVRVAFAVLGLAAGLGVALYLLLWMVGLDESLPAPRRSLRHDLGVVAATASALVMVCALIPSVPPQLLGPVAFVAFALAFSAGPEVGADLISGRAFGRIAVGLVLMLGGLFAGAAALGDLGQIWVIGTAVAAVTVGMGVVLAPWLRQLVDGASADRVERIRAEERADIAAHLHDSVLQTLTLIQNRAHEPQVASALAYQQERELRRWLYQQSAAADVDQESPGATPIRAELAQMVASVEDDYLVVVDMVCVGEATVDPSIRALVGAAREALVNAAKFAKMGTISLYVEVDDGRAVAFIRDRGIGFDPQLVAADRRGIANSIVARVERIGGAAVIRSSPGAGTEVRIEVPR